MTSNKSLYQNSPIGTQVLLALGALAMVVLSVYLTNHYFQVMFPSDISKGSLCDFGSFFNCDAATHSHASNIMGVPISVFGILIGLFVFVGFIFKSEKMEGSLFSVLALNFVGCIGLFLYSLIALGTLCPFCTLYYLASGLVLFLFYKHSNARVPHILPLGSMGIATLVISFFFYQNVQGRSQVDDSLAKELIQQYNSLPQLGHPKVGSGLFLAKSTENFTDAPLQLTIFSDYQCPACRMLSNITHDVAKKYKGKINIQYMFYPLDHNCNADITRPMNPLSCQGAYLSVCLAEKFDRVHDDIFANQEKLTLDWIQSYARKEGVLDCLNDEATKKKVQDIVAQSKPFSISSTPSMLINGVRTVGVLPANQLYMILDHLLAKSAKN